LAPSTPSGKSAENRKTTDRIQGVRTILGIAREALEACPTDIAKAVVGSVEKTLGVIQVGNYSFFDVHHSDEKAQ
jgi:hypothetical protein